MSKKAGTALSVMAMVFMGALASPLTVLAADAEETYQPALYATIWALLQPLVAIVLGYPGICGMYDEQGRRLRRIRTMGQQKDPHACGRGTCSDHPWNPDLH